MLGEFFVKAKGGRRKKETVVSRLFICFFFFLWAVKDEQVTNLGVIANTTFLQWHSHNLKMREKKKEEKSSTTLARRL